MVADYSKEHEAPRENSSSNLTLMLFLIKRSLLGLLILDYHAAAVCVLLTRLLNRYHFGKHFRTLTLYCYTIVKSHWSHITVLFLKLKYHKNTPFPILLYFSGFQHCPSHQKQKDLWNPIRESWINPIYPLWWNMKLREKIQVQI